MTVRTKRFVDPLCHLQYIALVILAIVHNSFELGQPCNSAAECTNGEECIRGFCQCSISRGEIVENGRCVANGNRCPGQFNMLINGKCFYSVALGGNCFSTGECLGSSVCINGICQCPSDFSTDGKVCQRRSQGNCPNGQVLVGQACMPLLSPGGTCQNNMQCTGGSTCILSRCTCLQGSTLVGTICQPSGGVSLPGGACRTQAHCSGGSNCMNGQCICPQGTTLVGAMCQATGPVSPPGGSCQRQEQCSGGSVCMNGRCTCPQGTILAGTICQMQSMGVPPGRPCQQQTPCLGGSICIGGICTCPQGTILVGNVCQRTSGQCRFGETIVAGMCRPMARPGEACYGDPQCYDGSACSSDYRCTCPRGLNNIYSYCRKLSFLEPCNQALQVNVQGVCQPLVSPSGRCISSKQCLSMSECIGGICRCPQGTNLINGYCVRYTGCATNQVALFGRCYNFVQIGGECMITQQCMGRSICDYSAQCQCPLGTMERNGQCVAEGQVQVNCSITEVQINGTCYQRRPPGQQCQFTQQCLDASTCVNNRCECPFGTRNSYGYCVRNELSQTCKDTEVMVSGQCHTFASPGQRCMFNQQCLAASVCNEQGQCACTTGYVDVMSYCVRTVDSGTCTSTEVFINGQCRTLPLLNQPCSQELRCQGGAVCQNGYCVCPAGTQPDGTVCKTQPSCGGNQVFYNGRCYDKAYPGQTCGAQTICQENSICQDGICKCPVGTYQNGAVCSSICATNQVFINGACVNKMYVGQPCLYYAPGQCQEGSRCVNGLCQCPEGTQQIGNTCQRSLPCPRTMINVAGQCMNLVYIGQNCIANEQCQGGAECQRSVCTCPAGKVPRGNICVGEQGSCGKGKVIINANCYPQVGLYEDCIYGQQCLANAECKDGRCVCANGSTLYNGVCTANLQCQPYQVFINGTCKDMVTIGMQCTSPDECQMARSTCMATDSTRTCQCATGTVYTGASCSVTTSAHCAPSKVFINNNQCINLVAFGQPCQYTSQCMGFSTCTGGLCLCPFGFQLVNNVCRSTT